MRQRASAMEKVALIIKDLGAIDPGLLAMALVAFALYVLLEAIRRIK
jgi:hypothetical protein